MSREKRREIVEFAKKIYQKGWVANHDGNLSCKLDDGNLLITPTAMSKGDIREDDLIVVDRAGNKIEGKRSPFSELKIHLAAYDMREDISSCIHSHAPHATAFSIAGLTLDKIMIPEFIVSLGNEIPVISYARAGSTKSYELCANFIRKYNALLMSGNGLLTVGANLEQAYYRMELVEHYCKIVYIAKNFGQNLDYISENESQFLLSKRKDAGLEPPFYRSEEKHLQESKTVNDERLKNIIIEEVEKILRK